MNKKIFVPLIIVISLISGLIFLDTLNYLWFIGKSPFVSLNGELPYFYRAILLFGCELWLIYGVTKLFVSRIQTPIKRLTQYVINLEHGIEQELFQCYDFEEYQALIVAIDNMAHTYHKTNRKLNYEKRKAEFILGYLEQGIIMLNDVGVVVETNDYTNDTLKLGIWSGKHITEVLQYVQCRKMVEQAVLSHEPVHCEVTHDETVLYFDMKALSKSRKYGYMISVRDITQIRQFDEMRYQFVSNVTHELKTPLTSIKGFVETLQMGAINQPDVAARFLEIIEIEADRLYTLINDILLLSDIEQTQLTVGLEAFNLRRLVYEVIELLSSQASQKLLKINYRLEDVTYKGDQNHFKQICINLLSNAIRYTEEGRINVSLRQDESNIFIIFQDTGVGIAPAHTDRIFERFYRVDKSRSRQSGGTGLGLSIVKHLIQLYDGEIFVDSKLGKGTIFTVKFKR
ncbi:MAG: hypothetical protein ATN34_02785 [Epulopiscium sp. Nele67-Bin002]|nr:MAG: hypothetical protein BEN18_09360 [Epulopiscium sp. Nuni2H_MBin001]OON90828.1 MAG: hypothetical protein ATN34_02785 [Epulopiscium sp. Nele67-Bin002]OON92187.1 MAG: hypothetical protein ATN33_07795 [Epulopiscium sp. Nele67-Bin001]